MKKMKDYGQFINEKKSEDDLMIEKNEDVVNENIFIDYLQGLDAIPDVHTKIFWSLGLLLGFVTTTGFAGTILTLIGKGLWFKVEDTELGKRIKEMIDKLKSAYKKKYVNKEEAVDEIKDTLDEYQDVVQELKSGKLGKGGEEAAKILDKTKENVESVQGE